MCRTPVTVTTIYRDDDEVQAALGGENLRLRLSGVDEEDIAPGFVICSRNTPVPCVTYFDAQLQVPSSASWPPRNNEFLTGMNAGEGLYA